MYGRAHNRPNNANLIIYGLTWIYVRKFKLTPVYAIFALFLNKNQYFIRKIDDQFSSAHMYK